MNESFDANQAKKLSINSDTSELNQILSHIKSEAKNGNNEAFWYADISDKTKEEIMKKGFSITRKNLSGDIPVLQKIVITW